MYKIIATDNIEYGPVTAEQVCDWIKQRRANAQTRARVEGSEEWKTLASFPEFSVALGLASPTAPPPLTVPPPFAKSSNRVAAGVCGILLGGLGVHKFVLGYTTAGVIMLLVTVLTCGWGWFVIHTIGLIEGIIYLTKSEEEFSRTYEQNRKEWF